VVSAGTKPESMDSRLDAIPGPLRQIAAVAVEYLSPRFESVLNLTMDDLLERANTADSADERRAGFEVAQKLAVRRDECVGFFINDFLAGFAPVPRGRRAGSSTSPSAAQTDHLELLNGDALELSVAVSTTTSRSANRYRSHLDQLTSTIASIGGGPGMTSRGNPLGVFRITGSFVTAIARMGLEVGVQRLLLDYFEREVITPLGELYIASCRLLDIEVPVDSAGNDLAPPQLEHGDTGCEELRTAAGFVELRELLRRATGTPSNAWSGAGGQPGVSSSQLSRTLSSRGDFGGRPTGGVALNLLELAAAVLAESGGTLDQVDPAARDVLQLVSLLFEHILEDEQLSLPIAAQISRLQIPVLKVALLDSTLFDAPAHVVRQVINRLGAVGIGWSADTEQVRRDPLYAQICGIVGRIVDSCDEDSTVFEVANEELHAVAAAHAKRAATLERRLTESADGRARVSAAKAMVQDFVNARVKGVRLPPGMSEFITEGWTQVLIYLCLKYGVDSETWTDARGALDEFLLLGQPAASAAEVEKRVERAPGLLREFRRWFDVAGIDSSRVPQLIKTLHDALDELNRADRHWLEQEGEYEVREYDEIEVIELVPAVDRGPVSLDPDLEVWLQTLQPGVWVEIRPDGEVPIRCKLATILEQTRNYLFVDNRGLRVDEIPALRVAEQLRDGRMKELKGDPVVERALDAMISELRESMRN
jgi:hypothetical protein